MNVLCILFACVCKFGMASFFCSLPTQVNSVSVVGMTHEEALKALQCVLDRMSLLVCDGYDPSAVPYGEEYGSSLSWPEEGD